MAISFHYQWKNELIIIRNFRRKIAMKHYFYNQNRATSCSGKYILILVLTHRQMVQFFLRIILEQFYENL